MILIDLNLLLYAYNQSVPEHESARHWLEGVLSNPEPVLLPWATVLGFLRIVTNPRALSQPLALKEAVEIVDTWLSLPHVGLIQPGERHWGILRNLLPSSQSRGPLVSDAHLAALAIEHGAVLYSNDRDFTRYAGLRVVNPLEA